MNALQTEMMNFYGSVNEMKEGITKTLPDKPQAYVLWEQCQEMNRPLIDGGIMDQPHIFMQEVAVIRDVKALFDLANQRAG